MVIDHIILLILTLLKRRRERECQRLRKEVEDKQTLYLNWAQRFEVKSGGDWRPGDDGGQNLTISLTLLHDHLGVQMICQNISNQCSMTASTRPMPVRSCVVPARVKPVGWHGLHESALNRKVKLLN